MLRAVLLLVVAALLVVLVVLVVLVRVRVLLLLRGVGGLKGMLAVGMGGKAARRRACLRVWRPWRPGWRPARRLPRCRCRRPLCFR